MDGVACPCGLGDDFESCCGRLHAGAPAPTAESVQFRAMYVRQGQRGVLAETSEFVRHRRHWSYLGPVD